MNPTKLRNRLLAGALGAALALPALAQDDLNFTLQFREPTDILQVIDVVNEVTGRRMIPDPRVRGIQVILYNSDPMTANEVWQLFLEMLQGSGLVAIETTSGAWRIVPEQNLRTEATPTGGTGAEVVTRQITVDNVSATQLVPILRPMMSQAAQLGAIPGTNTLIIVDRADNLERLSRVLDIVDEVNAPEISLVPLQYAAAEDVTQKLQQLVQGQTASGLVGLQAIADERTNSVLLTGASGQIEKYREMVQQLDRPATQGGGSQVRYLNYADAEDVAANLQAQFSGAQVEVDAETAADPTGGRVSVWADIPTNSLVMAAPSSVMRDMLAIVDALDIPRAQVHVQAIIVEMSDDRAAELGLTWIVDGSDDGEVIGLTNFTATTGGILQLAQVGQDGDPDPGLIRDGLTAAIGNLSDSGTSWAAVVSALQGDAETSVLQMPELVVLDNAEASINVGQEVPFLTGQYAQTGAGGGAGINPFSTIEREPVGTTLTITPRINEGTGMRLTIQQVVSSISSSAVASDVITNNREILTEVFVEDGDILVLGGLMDDQLRLNEQRVPFLGRIPGLKWLFSARNTERGQSNLMVFIRPTILRDSLDASRLSGEKYRLLQEQQRIRAEEPVPLMRDTQRPTLPPLPEPAVEPQDETPAPVLPDSE